MVQYCHSKHEKAERHYVLRFAHFGPCNHGMEIGGALGGGRGVGEATAVVVETVEGVGMAIVLMGLGLDDDHGPVEVLV